MQNIEVFIIELMAYQYHLKTTKSQKRVIIKALKGSSLAKLLSIEGGERVIEEGSFQTSSGIFLPR